MKVYGCDRGSTIMGTKAAVLVDRGGYEIYDLKGNKTSEFKRWCGDLVFSDLARAIDDGCSFRKLHRRNSQRREAQRSDRRLATSPLPCCNLQHCVGGGIGSCNSTPTMAASRGWTPEAYEDVKGDVSNEKGWAPKI